METQLDPQTRASIICDRLAQYFGAEYEVSSNNFDVFTVKSRLKPCAYVESEDILIVNNIVADFGLAIEKWRLVAANDQVGIYCVLTDRDQVDRSADMVADDLKPIPTSARA